MILMKHIITLIAFILSFSAGTLAQLPDGDIWLLDMSEKQGRYDFTNPKNITERPGYDNQPSFTPDGKNILYTSIREDNQADVYRYNISTAATTRLTSSFTSEYSPTVMPGGKYFSVVMVEQDSTQRLWKYPLKGGKPKLILPRIDSIGYHCWYDKKNVALFMLTHPFTLELANLGSQELRLLGNNIGRSINRVVFNKKNLLFYIYSAPHETSRYIVACDAAGKHDYINAIKTPEGSEDLAVIKNQVLVMAQGSKLLKYDLVKDKIWTEIADLESFGINNITRIAISPDGSRIAVVSNK